ncbi:hypothetical protein [Streptomyces sp. SAS_276]|uniref:hypothetical protein n=1 Tax=Streptomyces sp. SAS_276 TaxID=3412745 RepID=UPI00403C853F
MEATPRRNLREEQKKLTHRRLLDAAVTVLTEKPFLDARMEDIVQAAGGNGPRSTPISPARPRASTRWSRGSTA